MKPVQWRPAEQIARKVEQEVQKQIGDTIMKIKNTEKVILGEIVSRNPSSQDGRIEIGDESKSKEKTRHENTFSSDEIPVIEYEKKRFKNFIKKLFCLK